MPLVRWLALHLVRSLGLVGGVHHRLPLLHVLPLATILPTTVLTPFLVVYDRSAGSQIPARLEHELLVVVDLLLEPDIFDHVHLCFQP